MQLLGLEAIEALAAKSELARARFEEVGACRGVVSMCAVWRAGVVIDIFGRVDGNSPPPLPSHRSHVHTHMHTYVQAAAEELFCRIFTLHVNDRDLQSAACQVGNRIWVVSLCGHRD